MDLDDLERLGALGAESSGAEPPRAAGGAGSGDGNAPEVDRLVELMDAEARPEELGASALDRLADLGRRQVPAGLAEQPRRPRYSAESAAHARQALAKKRAEQVSAKAAAKLAAAQESIDRVGRNFPAVAKACRLPVATAKRPRVDEGCGASGAHQGLDEET